MNQNGFRVSRLTMHALFVTGNFDYNLSKGLVDQVWTHRLFSKLQGVPKVTPPL